MPLSGRRSWLHALLLGVLLATLIAAPPLAGAASLVFDADALGAAVGIPTAAPAVYAETLTGIGFAPTVGHFRLEGHHEANAATGTVTRGVLTITLIPGGDTIAGTYSGLAFTTVDPAKFDFVGEVVFIGGTGRFARARGRGPLRGQLEIRNITPDGGIQEAVTLQFDGRLTL